MCNMYKLVFLVSLFLTAQGSSKDDAMKYIQGLIDSYSSTATKVETDLIGLSSDLHSNYNVTMNTTFNAGVKMILSYNDKAYTQNCDKSVFWAINGVRNMINPWFVSCVDINDVLIKFQNFLTSITTKIETGKLKVADGITYVSKCPDDDPNLDECVANGTLAFLTLMNSETHELNADKLRATSYEQEWLVQFQSCSDSVGQQVVDDLTEFLQEFCFPTVKNRDGSPIAQLLYRNVI